MKTYKILVIDDAFFVRNLIKKAIGRKPSKNDINFEIIGEASDGSEGLRLCEELHPDIITVDFNIPELNGLDFAKYLKESNPNVPILMISSNNNPEFPSQVERIGCYFLAKPFQESFLWIRLDKIVEEIDNNQTNTIHEENSDENFDLMKEISAEVEAEMEEITIELEDDIDIPKSESQKKQDTDISVVSKKKRKKKKKNKSTNNILGLTIDDSIVIKPKIEEQKEPKNEKSRETVTVSKVDDVQSESIIQPLSVVKLTTEFVEEKIIEDLNIKKSIPKSVEIENNVLSTEKLINDSETEILITEEPLTAEVDGEEIIIEEEDAPIIIDDEEDEIFIIDNDTEEEIIIENENDELIVEEIEENSNQILDLDDLEDFFIDADDLDVDRPKVIGLNIQKAPFVIEEENLSEKDKIIKILKENVNYSYQNEMSYVLHVMEKINKQHENNDFNDNNENSENKSDKPLNRILNKGNMNKSDDFMKEKMEEDAEFDKLFAEFNPNMKINNEEESNQELLHENSRKKILKDAPSIAQNIVIEPPKNERIRKLYNKEENDESQLIVPIDEKQKISIFTKIFNFFSRKKN